MQTKMSNAPFRWNPGEIRLFLTTNNLTPEDFAKMIGRTPRLVQAVLRGDVKHARMRTFIQAAESLENSGQPKHLVKRMLERRSRIR